MKRIIPMSLVFIACNSVYADTQESNTIDEPLTQLESTHDHKEESVAHLESAEIDSINPEDATTQEKPTLFGSFQKFIRIFLILLNNQKLQGSLKTIEGMVLNLVQTALQALRSSIISPHDNNQDIAKKLLESDPALKRAMTNALTKSSALYNPMPTCKAHGPWCCQKPKQADKNAKIVLENFAQIASHFINILQNPNDSEEVAPNLIGMLGSIINIGTHVIKSGNFTIDSTPQELAHYIENLDTELKEEFVRTISRTLQQSYFTQ